MTKAEAAKELEKYVGLPKCMDCGWRLGTDITNNCGCVCIGSVTPERKALYDAAFKRARELQAIVMDNFPGA